MAVRAAATMAVSRGPKAPRWNSPPAIASDSTANATAAGNDKASAISSARDCVPAPCPWSPPRRLAAMAGPSTEAIAIEMTPSGSS